MKTKQPQGNNRKLLRTDYRKVAKSLGVKYLFGRWGLTLGSNYPDGGRDFKIRFIPLDGWKTDPNEVYKEMKKRDFKI